MSQNNCGCTEQTPTPCTQPTVCECKVFLKSDCINNVTSVFECLDVESGLSLTETLEAIDQAICDKFSTITNFFTLINTGTGSEISNGVNNLGQKKIRKINNGTSNLIVVTQNTDDISITINTNNLITFIQDNQLTYSLDSVGSGASLVKSPNTVDNNTEFILKNIGVSNQGGTGASPIRDILENNDEIIIRAKKLKSSDNSVTITQTDTEIDFQVEVSVSDTVLEEGTNVTITGAGTTLNPYIINATDTDTIITLENGDTTSVSGDGVTTPYSVEVLNLQKVVSSFPYTLLSTDDKHTIFVQNGASSVVINVPNGLPNNFSVAFIQKGSGDVQIASSGSAIINTAIGDKIKGQNYWALLEREIATTNYYLIGSLKL